MGNETSKTNQLRGDDFIAKYFSGKVIDIGGGNDPVVPNARVFDRQDGDAQYISRYEKQASYDCVHSSHCLEHMVHVESALSEWWSLVKPNGYMVITVPDEDLYEQKIWPSIFNTDHKATFRLKKQTTWSEVSYDLFDICSALPHVSVIDASIQDAGYDYKLQYKNIGKRLRNIHRWQFSKNSAKRFFGRMVYRILYCRYYANSTKNIGIPIDQTGGNALAQIQIVLQKTA